MFVKLMGSKSLPEEEKSMYRLSGEGLTFLLAGTETTAATLTVFTFWLLEKPAVYARLMHDLDCLDPNNVKWLELGRKPYLWATIEECLRMMPSVSHRSAQIARDEDLVYNSQDDATEWVIPRGTPIGTTSTINYWNKELFPNPHDSIPERWLVDDLPNYQLQIKAHRFR